MGENKGKRSGRLTTVSGCRVDAGGAATRLEVMPEDWPIIEAVKVVLYRVDIEGRWSCLDSAWTAVTGFSAAESIGRPFASFFHPEEQEKYRELFQKIMAGEIESGWSQGRYFTKQGKLRWLEMHFKQLVAAGGAVSGITGTMLDITGYLLATQASVVSERRYGQLFRDSRAVKLVVDPDGGWIIDANQAAADFYGYSVAELKALKVFDISATPAEKLLEYLAASRICKSYVFSPVEHRMQNGSRRYVEVFTTTVDIGGRTLLQPIIFDVTDRRRLEEELENSQERLALVLAGAKAGVWDWDMVSGQVYYDRRWKAIIGYADNEIGSGFEEWRSRWHPADAARIEQAMADYQAGRTDKYEIEYRLRHKDGTYRWILATGKLTCDQSRRPIRWVGSIIDITDRKHTEELLLASETKLRDFAQAVPDVSFILDEDGLCIEAFGSNEQHMPLAKADPPGRTLQELLPVEDAEKLLALIRQTASTGRPGFFARERQAADGATLFIEGWTAPMKYTANGKRTVALVVSDVTGRRRAEAMLDYAYRLRRRSDFLNDLIAGKLAAREQDGYYDHSLGLGSPAPTFCCLALNDGPDGGNGYSRDEASLGVQRLREKAIQAIDGLADMVAWDCREGIGVLCRLPDGGERAQGSLATAAAIQSRLKQFFPESPIYVGISEFCPAGDVRIMFREAFSALLAARCGTGDQTVVHYRDAGIFQFLPAAGSREQALEFVNRQLGRLLEYDWRRGTDYLGTLEELLNGSSVRETAAKLFLHPKTLLFRRKRIQVILGASLDSPETRLALALAIKLLHLYNKF